MTVRILLPLAALVTALYSIAVEQATPSPAARICVRGGCRYDQMFSSVERHGASPAALAALVEEDPSNPHAWADYGEYLASAGERDSAEQVFAQSIGLGSGLAPVLMRAANFDFTHGRSGLGLALAPRILSQTSDYDEILFSYLNLFGLGPADLWGGSIRPSPRAARSWLRWTLNRSSDNEILTTWAWLKSQGLADEESAAETVKMLWQHQAYGEAHGVWLDWLGSRAGDYPRKQLLANARFEAQPSSTPFDWDLSPRPGVAYSRGKGLEIRFLGQENVTDAGVQQYAVVSPGPYRLTAEVSTRDISTDEGVFFEITDKEHPDRLRAQSDPLLGSRLWGTTTLEFTVPAGTHVLRVQLARKASTKFDNQLAGVLWLHRLALEPCASQ